MALTRNRNKDLEYRRPNLLCARQATRREYDTRNACDPLFAMPENFKWAVRIPIVLIFSKWDLQELTNYRPICLHSVLRKVFTKVISNSTRWPLHLNQPGWLQEGVSYNGFYTRHQPGNWEISLHGFATLRKGTWFRRYIVSHGGIA